ncbi:hypothetical protein AB1Y20_014972 [Prymnesium parvum]|uniref:DUF676 domain-containing protein n=1 Tax=Prymnesium parvum TaxID=97485 RepID=A0AB34JYR8_PRYPA
MSAPEDAVWLFVLQHGIDGHTTDLDAIRARTTELATARGISAVVWDADVNEGSATHHGVIQCAARLWEALEPKLSSQLELHKGDVRLSFVGHSLGGLILRVVAARLYEWRAGSPARLRVLLDTFMSIATPHLGCRTLGQEAHGGVGPAIRASTAVMRAGLRATKRTTGSDLLLDSDTLDRISTGVYIQALSSFRARVNVANLDGDWVCPFACASLLDAAECDYVHSQTGLTTEGRASVLWCAADHTDAEIPPMAPPPTVCVTPSEAKDTCCIVMRELPESWDPSSTLSRHMTWDDFGRAGRAVKILRHLRSSGSWELYIARFGRQASFISGCFTPHIDIVAIPLQIKETHGNQVVEHIAGLLLRPSDVSRS